MIIYPANHAHVPAERSSDRAATIRNAIWRAQQHNVRNGMSITLASFTFVSLDEIAVSADFDDWRIPADTKLWAFDASNPDIAH